MINSSNKRAASGFREAFGHGQYTKLITKCWDTCKIKPVIDIRNMWQDKEETRGLRDLENVTYNHKGQVYCCCPVTGKVRETACSGFEKDRDTLQGRGKPRRIVDIV